MKRSIIFILCINTWALIFAQSSSNMTVISQWDDTTIVPVGPPGSQRINEVWGYEQNGREYAVVGSTEGMHFIDITDSSNVVEVDFVGGWSQGNGHVHRDMKNLNQYLYCVADQGPSSMQVIDMSYLPDSVHLVYDSDSLVIRAHNVFVDTAMAKLYVFGPRSKLFTGGPPQGFPVMRFSLADPVNPTLIDTFWHNIIGYVHDGYAFNDTVIFNSGWDGLYYGYLGTPGSPVELDYLPFYQDQGYNHSGWFTPNREWYALADETHGMRMKMIDMRSGPTQFSTCTLLEHGVDSFPIPHNQMITGNYLFSSWYFDGVVIWNIEDPCNPIKIAWYDTHPWDAFDGGYMGAWGVYSDLPSGKILVSDMHSGLYVFRFTDPTLGDFDLEIPDLTAYPNPTMDFVNLNKSYERIKLMDTHGKLIREIPNSSRIDLTGLSSGMYLLQIEDEGKFGQLKIMKQ